MARVTVEDCIEQVPNRFQLVQMAAIRAKQLKRGATAYVGRDDNKEVVTALREIAAGIVKPDELSDAAIEALENPEVAGVAVAAQDTEVSAEDPAESSPASEPAPEPPQG